MPFEFANPWFLALLPVPILVWLVRRRTRRAALRYSSLQLFSGIKPAIWPSRIGEGLRFLALLCLVLALAGPRSPDLKTRVPAFGISIMFVLDTSGSMEAEYPWEADGTMLTRREAARRAFQLFVAGGDGPEGVHFDGRSTDRGTDALGLITFATWPQPVCPPTLNHSVLLKVLDEVRPASDVDTNTNVGDALVEGLLRLQHAPTKRRVLILLSDGEHNISLADKDRDPLKPSQAAGLAEHYGIPIYTIDVGGLPKTGEDATTRLAGQEINKRIAEMTKGKFFSASNGHELLAACQEIDQLERGPILSAVYRRYHEYDWMLALVAAGATALLFFLNQTVWRSVP